MPYPGFPAVGRHATSCAPGAKGISLSCYCMPFRSADPAAAFMLMSAALTAATSNSFARRGLLSIVASSRSRDWCHRNPRRFRPTVLQRSPLSVQLLSLGSHSPAFRPRVLSGRQPGRPARSRQAQLFLCFSTRPRPRCNPGILHRSRQRYPSGRHQAPHAGGQRHVRVALAGDRESPLSQCRLCCSLPNHRAPT